jgi:F-type H+/Na+-transporting ATPase subunit alpha
VLKQPQYQPVPVDQQILVIFAVTNGFLDDVDVAKIREFERGYLDFMASSHPQIGEEIRTKKAISEDLNKRLSKAIAEFKSLGAR